MAARPRRSGGSYRPAHSPAPAPAASVAPAIGPVASTDPAPEPAARSVDQIEAELLAARPTGWNDVDRAALRVLAERMVELAGVDAALREQGTTVERGGVLRPHPLTTLRTNLERSISRARRTLGLNVTQGQATRDGRRYAELNERIRRDGGDMVGDLFAGSFVDDDGNRWAADGLLALPPSREVLDAYIRKSRDG